MAPSMMHDNRIYIRMLPRKRCSPFILPSILYLFEHFFPSRYSRRDRYRIGSRREWQNAASPTFRCLRLDHRFCDALVADPVVHSSSARDLRFSR